MEWAGAGLPGRRGQDEAGDGGGHGREGEGVDSQDLVAFGEDVSMGAWGERRVWLGRIFPFYGIDVSLRISSSIGRDGDRTGNHNKLGGMEIAQKIIINHTGIIHAR